MERLFRYKLDHILFWMLTIGFHAYTHSGIIDQAGFGQFVLELLVRDGLLAFVIYINLLVIIPGLNQQKRTGLFILLIPVTLVCYVGLKNLHDVYLYGIMMDNPARQGFFHNTFYNFSIVVFYLAFASTLYLSKQWHSQKELIRKIELEKLNTELEYLKAQINPHFLFNSLNTVFFQIDKQNTAARETLSKFSDMLRYQLYECNGKEIAVEKEIRYLKNYVALQRLRKDEHYDIRFSCAEGLKNFTLPPLLLLPFIENAFKHVSHFSDKKNIIDIDISKTGDFFQLKIFNTKDSRQVSTHSGIGLKNVQRRLELLYTERYKLNIIDHPESFNVQLNLKVM
ncbi:MAG: sensor histidine kinase [Cyclobacteriaceae bacterium]|nr:sensor histidine kinase [Cyclobacteriaceae bacterium]